MLRKNAESKGGLYRKHLWLWVTLLIFILAAVKTIVSPVKGDFLTYYNAAVSGLEGKPRLAYEGNDYTFVYTPFAYLAMSPLGLFQQKTARLMLHVLDLIALVASGLMLGKLFAGKHGHVPWLMGTALLLTARFMFNNFSYGQVNLIILFFMVAAIYLLYTGKPVLSAVLMAVTISFKLTPLILVPYFLLKRKIRYVLMILAALLVVNLLLPVISWGCREAMGVFSSWYGAQVHLGGMNLTKLSNYSLFSFLSRYLSAGSWSDRGLFTVNFLSLSRRQVFFLYGLLTAIAAVMFTVRAAKRGAAGAGRQGLPEVFKNDIGEYSLLITGMLLLSPVAWQHHFTLLLIPHLYLVKYILENRGDRKVRALVTASFVLNTATAPGIAGKTLSNVFMSYSFITLGCMLVAAAAAICYDRERKHDK